MSRSKRSSLVAEFGDFQTPDELAQAVIDVVSRSVVPRSVVEPTCGQGAFLRAARQCFPQAERFVGLDINADHLRAARAAMRSAERDQRTLLIQADFFDTDWRELLSSVPEPILVIGNPPWVTNSQQGAIGGGNLPIKSNHQKLAGMEAVTGKSNFDISEWMLMRLLEAMRGRRGTLAMLCKTAVARKALRQAWNAGLEIARAEVHLIDAMKNFGVSVDACLLVCHMAGAPQAHQCEVWAQLGRSPRLPSFGLRDGKLVANLDAYQRRRHLQGLPGAGPYRWRSGVKHDCRRVMEFRREGGNYRNGLDELVDIEHDYLYPLLKSSDLARGPIKRPGRAMLVPQCRVGQSTDELEMIAPKTWNYLQTHADLLDRRKSSIYNNRPRFSVFGVGDYTFSPWKVAISGFYKRLQFRIVPSWRRKPTVLDDTSYFIACQSRAEAEHASRLLNSQVARDFYSAFIFWDAKRPITGSVLELLDIAALAKELGGLD